MSGTALPAHDGPALFPRRFRRRLAIAVVVIAATAAGTLAVGAYWTIRRYRTASFDTRVESIALANLDAVPPYLDRSTVDRLLEVFAARGTFETVLSWQGVDRATSPLNRRAVPAELAVLPATGVALAESRVAGDSYTVAGATLPDDGAIYLFFSRRDLQRSLADFSRVLAIEWAVVVLGASVAGSVIARRTLAPVRAAASAAGRLAEGLLDTRLPVDKNDEFGTWAAHFNTMAVALGDTIRDLEAAHERERRFTEDAAHELRTPLAAMVTHASLLDEQIDDIPDGARRPAELLIADVRRIRRLADDLLELARAEAEDHDANVEEVALHELTAATIRSCGWENMVAVDLPPTTINSTGWRIERIISNLVANAVTHGGDNVRVQLGRTGDDILLSVIDTGPGIDPSDVERIFDRFYVADPSRTGKGNGLGLAIAAEHARRVGARIDVASEPSGGSRFTVRFSGVSLPDDSQAGPPSGSG